MPRRKKIVREDDKTIGRRLRDARLRQGITQAELAARLGIKQPMVSLYECGDVRLNAPLVAGFAQALGVTSDEILGLQPSPDNGALQDRRLVRRLKKVEHLSRRDRQTLIRTIDRFLKGSGAS